MNIVLINPEIPFNTGNIGRTCVATNSTLHLVGKLGFEINSKEIRRSGLDYWKHLKYKVYKDFDEFLQKIPPTPNLLFFSTKGTKTFWDANYDKNCYLIFGSEGKGLPKSFYTKYKNQLYKIPQTGKVRSLNLSTSVGIVLFEAIRQQN